MKKQIAMERGEPQLARKVEARRGKRAKVGYSRQGKIEIGRLWLPKKAAARPTFRILRGKGAAVLELPAHLAGIEPPNIKAEPLTAARFRKLNIRKREDGHYPAHLPLAFKPKLIERIRPRQIRRGYDLPNFVFTPDTRYIFHDTSFPWCTTGKVETAGGSCTGTMIGRRLMLTGSHCMEWTRDGAGWVKFTPAYYNGAAPFGVAWGERVIYWSRVDGSDGVSDQETAFDYVVIVLDRNMGDLTGYAGYRAYSSSWNGGNYWQQIGYPGDLSGGQRPAFFGGGAISSVQSKSTSGQTGYVLGHFMDTSPGHSGGPYWGWWGDEPWPRVVGTDSTSPSKPGNDTSGDNEAGGGPALSSLIAYARTNYP
jgi:V8-like Glu-specific endopeptidase